MKDYKAKDLILKKLSEIEATKGSILTLDMAKEINVSHEQVYSCCFEMLKRDHIKAVDVATIGAKFAYQIYIHPVGENFLKNNGGYSKEYSKSRWDTFPQRRWWLIAIFAFLFGFISELAKDPISAWIKERWQYPQKGNTTQSKFGSPNKTQ